MALLGQDWTVKLQNCAETAFQSAQPYAAVMTAAAPRLRGVQLQMAKTCFL